MPRLARVISPKGRCGSSGRREPRCRNEVSTRGASDRHMLTDMSIASPDYYRLLTRVTAHQEWEPWILYMLEVIEITASWTNQRIRAIRHLMDATSAYVRNVAPKIHSRDLIDLIFAQPYSRIGNLVARGIAKRQAASTYLKVACGASDLGRREDRSRQGLLTPEVSCVVGQRRA